MSLFPKTCMALLRYSDFIDKFAEAGPGDTFENIVSDIFNGEYLCHRVLAVYSVGSDQQTKDISNDVCDALITRIRKGEHASQLAKDFIVWCDKARDYAALEYGAAA